MVSSVRLKALLLGLLPKFSECIEPGGHRPTWHVPGVEDRFTVDHCATGPAGFRLTEDFLLGSTNGGKAVNCERHVLLQSASLLLRALTPQEDSQDPAAVPPSRWPLLIRGERNDSSSYKNGTTPTVPRENSGLGDGNGRWDALAAVPGMNHPSGDGISGMRPEKWSAQGASQSPKEQESKFDSDPDHEDAVVVPAPLTWRDAGNTSLTISTSPLPVSPQNKEEADPDHEDALPLAPDALLNEPADATRSARSAALLRVIISVLPEDWENDILLRDRVLECMFGVTGILGAALVCMLCAIPIMHIVTHYIIGKISI